MMEKKGEKKEKIRMKNAKYFNKLYKSFSFDIILIKFNKRYIIKITLIIDLIIYYFFLFRHLFHQFFQFFNN